MQGADRKKARRNCIHHLLSLVKYGEVEREVFTLPPWVRHPDYHREPVPPGMIVPGIY